MSGTPEPGTSERGKDPARRDFLRRLARGVTWSAPVISTLAAPSSALAQASPMGMPMMTLCDYFPVLCMFLGLDAGAGGAVPQAPGSESPWVAPPTPPLPEAPWSAPPPGSE